METDDSQTLAEEAYAIGETQVAEHQWAEAARSFRRAAGFYCKAGSHKKEGDALWRAAQSYEALQTWRIAGNTWLEVARAYTEHPPMPPERIPKTKIGEAYLWAGNTFSWADHHYESFRSHILAGQAFEEAEDWARAERAYRSAAISKATALATLGQINRDVHAIYKAVESFDLVAALGRVTVRRREGPREEREFAVRSHIDSLFAVRRSLEAAGNQEEARGLYKLEMDARRAYAKEYAHWRRWLWLAFFGIVLGYGESLSRLAFFSVLLFLVAFPMAYAVVPTVQGADNLWDDIYFSLVTATTLGYGDLTPQETAKWISNLESILGLVAFGLLISILVRRVSR